VGSWRPLNVGEAAASEPASASRYARQADGRAGGTPGGGGESHVEGGCRPPDDEAPCNGAGDRADPSRANSCDGGDAGAISYEKAVLELLRASRRHAFERGLATLTAGQMDPRGYDYHARFEQKPERDDEAGVQGRGAPGHHAHAEPSALPRLSRMVHPATESPRGPSGGRAARTWDVTSSERRGRASGGARHPPAKGSDTGFTTASSMFSSSGSIGPHTARTSGDRWAASDAFASFHSNISTK